MKYFFLSCFLQKPCYQKHRGKWMQSCFPRASSYRGLKKKIPVNSFTWGGTVFKEHGTWLFTDHLERILIFFQLDDINKVWLWNKFCESEHFSGWTMLVLEGKLLYLIICLNLSVYIGYTFSLLGDMLFADKCFSIQTGKHPWSPAPLVR